MAKIKPMALIEGMSGKVCTHSDTSFVRSKKTGRIHTMKLCNPYEGPASASQIAHRTKFQTAAAAAKAICRATASDENQANFTKKTAYREQFDAQAKNPSFFAFVMQKEFAELNS